jgi:catechol 2,3-dioxygenase-like lactoylglutathione lyase family enzyme
MAVSLNHVIVWSKDQKEGSKFLAHVLGLPGPTRFAHFDVVTIDGISFDYANSRGAVQRQHLAFLVSEAEFDQIFARLKAKDVPYWSDPLRQKPNEICPDDGGRGIYFPDPSDHNLEIITRPYSREAEASNRNPQATVERNAAGD